MMPIENLASSFQHYQKDGLKSLLDIVIVKTTTGTVTIVKCSFMKGKKTLCVAVIVTEQILKYYEENYEIYIEQKYIRI